jgi:hypothetical protein
MLSLNVKIWNKLVHFQIYMGQPVTERLLESLHTGRDDQAVRHRLAKRTRRIRETTLCTILTREGIRPDLQSALTVELGIDHLP